MLPAVPGCVGAAHASCIQAERLPLSDMKPDISCPSNQPAPTSGREDTMRPSTTVAKIRPCSPPSGPGEPAASPFAAA